MSNDDTPDGSEPPHVLNGKPEEATPLEIAIRNVVRREQRQEDFAEKCTYAYAEDGKVRIPRSNKYVTTDQERILLVGTDDYVFKDYIEGPLRKLFDVITSSDRSTWREVKGARRGVVLPETTFELTRLGQQVMQACFCYDPAWAVAYMHHEFHPKVAVMLRAMRSNARVIHRFGVAGSTCTQKRVLVQALERVVRFVRRVVRSWTFINALKAHERQAQENFESGREFLYYAAEGHSKLLILRIDLYYRPYYDVAGADKAVHSFLRWLRSPACRRNVLPSYLGFLVKRENGLVRGMHYHVMVICKGNQQQSAYYLTRLLGEHWAKITGQGPGSFHNCYADKDTYEANGFNGLGVMTLDDWEQMAGLRAALWYMTKADCVIKATNSKVKNFWRSPIPKQVRKKLGRPRASADPLKLLRRMLGGKRSKFPPGLGPRDKSRGS
ncbi:MAG: inovirus-type Gp2 protein [Xanthomonadales bacterium]|nr:inovirus-type Gp2 protein [Xanthomonadales bacterium]